jgi:hypothetical protein
LKELLSGLRLLLNTSPLRKIRSGYRRLRVSQNQSLIKGLLNLLLVIVVSLLSINILGCSTVPQKTEAVTLPISKIPCPETSVELWRIDSKRLELYRVLNGATEESLPISDSLLMKKFIALDIAEYGKLIEGFYGECRK